jgi:hypothetical protein
MWIEAQAGLHETRIRDLNEILLVLSPMEELSGKPLGQPHVGGDYLVENLLPPEGPCRLGLEEQLTGTFGQFFTGHMLRSGDDNKRGLRHERATLS